MAEDRERHPCAHCACPPKSHPRTGRPGKELPIPTVGIGIHPEPPKCLDSFWGVCRGGRGSSLLDQCPLGGSVWERPGWKSKVIRHQGWFAGWDRWLTFRAHLLCQALFEGQWTILALSIFATILWSQLYYYPRSQKRKRSTERSITHSSSTARKDWSLNPDPETAWSWRLHSWLRMRCLDSPTSSHPPLEDLLLWGHWLNNDMASCYLVYKKYSQL